MSREIRLHDQLKPEIRLLGFLSTIGHEHTKDTVPPFTDQKQSL